MQSTARRILLQSLVGIFVGIFLLWLVFRDTDWDAVLTSIRGANILWLVGTQLCFLCIFFARALRWGTIVRAAEQASFRALFSATQIAYLVNYTVSGRLGELVRPLVLSRLSSVRFMTGFATVAADRVTDVIGMLSFLILALVAVNPDSEVIIPASTFGTDEAIIFQVKLIRSVTIFSAIFLITVLLGLTLVLGFGARSAGLMHRIVSPISMPLADRIAKWIEQFAQGLEVLRRPAEAFRALGYTALVWGLLALGSLCNLEAFDIDYPWFMPMLMTAFIAVFTSIPGPPGRFGQFHLPLIVCLVMVIPDTDLDHAKAFAIVAHVLGILPVIVVGFYCLFREQFNLFTVIRDSAAIEMDDADGD